ncbi:hypothetical protein I4U23_011076 [Adineta vaga]|nr:hypothetical protein I4U23_011076 [Adineta vaga]
MSYSYNPRQDRSDYTIPIVTQDEFYKKNFFKCYDQTIRNFDKAFVINSLRALEDGSGKFSSIIQSIENESDDYDVIRTYSSDMFVHHQKFYCYVNQQLCADNMETISKLMPMIRRATRQINYQAPASTLVVYRGFTSTSTSIYNAQIFGNTLFEIHIYAGCVQLFIHNKRLYTT